MMYIIGGIAVVVLLFVVIMINSLIGKKQNLQNCFSGIDVQLKKRCDLVPNLVACVQKYMEHERATLEQIAGLRSRAMNPETPQAERFEIDSKLSAAMRSIMVAVENYPQLQASDNVMQLQRSLNEIEEQLSAARRAYNAAVTTFNNAVEMFPSSIFASMMSYKRAEFFTIPEAERANVDVQALFNR